MVYAYKNHNTLGKRSNAEVIKETFLDLRAGADPEMFKNWGDKGDAGLGVMWIWRLDFMFNYNKKSKQLKIKVKINKINRKERKESVT